LGGILDLAVVTDGHAGADIDATSDPAPFPDRAACSDLCELPHDRALSYSRPLLDFRKSRDGYCTESQRLAPFIHCEARKKTPTGHRADDLTLPRDHHLAVPSDAGTAK
jgi:hypothetical protein